MEYKIIQQVLDTIESQKQKVKLPDGINASFVRDAMTIIEHRKRVERDAIGQLECNTVASLLAQHRFQYMQSLISSSSPPVVDQTQFNHASRKRREQQELRERVQALEDQLQNRDDDQS